MILIDGKKVSADIQSEIAAEVAAMKLAVGKNPASETYVNGKVRACEKVGFKSTLHRLDASVSENDLLQKISELNNDADVDGFIVQLPLPRHINVQKITE